MDVYSGFPQEESLAPHKAGDLLGRPGDGMGVDVVGVPDLSDSRGGGTQGLVRRDFGADRTIVAVPISSCHRDIYGINPYVLTLFLFILVYFVLLLHLLK